MFTLSFFESRVSLLHPQSSGGRGGSFYSPPMPLFRFLKVLSNYRIPWALASGFSLPLMFSCLVSLLLPFWSSNFAALTVFVLKFTFPFLVVLSLKNFLALYLAQYCRVSRLDADVSFSFFLRRFSRPGVLHRRKMNGSSSKRFLHRWLVPIFSDVTPQFFS